MSRALTSQRRIAALLARDGESVTLSHGGGTRTLLGIFRVTDPDTVAAYFDPATATGLARPVFILTLDGGQAPPAVGDTLARDGRTLTVRAVDIPRLAGVPVAALVLLS